MSVKPGDVVLYAAFGRTLNAIVLAAKNGTVSHEGKNGEPLLDLLFIDPARESSIEKKQIGWQPRLIVEHDVVHASHAFSAAFKKEKGISTPAQNLAQRGQGEWSAIIPEAADATGQLLDENQKLQEEVTRLEELLAGFETASSENSAPQE